MNSLTALFLLYEHIIPTQISNQNLLNILSMLPNCWIFSIRGVQQLFEAISTNCCRFALRSELQQHLLKYWNNEKKNLLQNSSLKKDPFGFRDLIVAPYLSADLSGSSLETHQWPSHVSCRFSWHIFTTYASILVQFAHPHTAKWSVAQQLLSKKLLMNNSFFFTSSKYW